jgi:hypothetical protein
VVADATPPFAVTAPILTLVAEIAERVGHGIVAAEGPASRRLRRVNRVRTIHGTLTIEGRRLQEDQITAILDGKRALAPPREAQEAIQDSTVRASVTRLIEFMLIMVRRALDELEPTGLAPDVTEQVTGQVPEQVRCLLAVVGESTCSAKTLMARLGLAHRPRLLYNYLRPAIAGGRLAMLDPEQPRNPPQRYHLTAAGRQFVASTPQEQGTP